MTQRDTGKVNINSDPQVPEGSPVPYPTHKILGIIPTEDGAWRAIDELKTARVPEEEIELWGGQAGADAMDESFSGIVGRLRRLSMDLAQPGDRYGEALRSGHFVLVVPAPNPEAKETVREIMVKHGGHYISYYDHLTIEILA